MRKGLETHVDPAIAPALARNQDGTIVPHGRVYQRVRTHPVMETIVKGLSNRSLLLILDNCEHLLDSCASLVDTILSACPGVRVLATSRQPLGLNGERIYRVQAIAYALCGMDDS